MKKVKQIISEVEERCEYVTHKAIGKTKIQPSDWIRVYHGGNCLINDMIYSCDWKDRDKIPSDILNTNVDLVSVWMIGCDLSLECVVLEDEYKEKYKGTVNEKYFV